MLQSTSDYAIGAGDSCAPSHSHVGGQAPSVCKTAAVLGGEVGDACRHAGRKGSNDSFGGDGHGRRAKGHQEADWTGPGHEEAPAGLAPGLCDSYGRLHRSHDRRGRRAQSVPGWCAAFFSLATSHKSSLVQLPLLGLTLSPRPCLLPPSSSYPSSISFTNMLCPSPDSPCLPADHD